MSLMPYLIAIPVFFSVISVCSVANILLGNYLPTRGQGTRLFFKCIRLTAMRPAAVIRVVEIGDKGAYRIQGKGHI